MSSESTNIKAFYFSKPDKKLRYGDRRLIKKGITHTISAPPKMCSYGLHASVNPIDALQYAPGPHLWLVNLSGEVVVGTDKVVATERTYLEGFDATRLLRKFACCQALINIKNIKKYCTNTKYQKIILYLSTQNEKYRLAAQSAAQSVAQSVAQSAAWSAAQSVAQSAAWSAESAARSAAESAQLAAESAARSAAWSAVSAAESAQLAAWSAESAARSAARSAANDMLRIMIEKELA